jgi:phage regulator Rha-like protein
VTAQPPEEAHQGDPHAYGVSVPVERVERQILVVRGRNVMLDSDVAALYGVSRRALLVAVKRNTERFPDGFVFQLNEAEFTQLQAQALVEKGRRAPPCVFTEEGVAMLSGVLTSPRAIQINIEVMQTFIRLREALAGREDLSQRVQQLEQRYDTQFKQVFDALNKLTPPLPEESKPRLGFPLPENPS